MPYDESALAKHISGALPKDEMDSAESTGKIEHKPGDHGRRILAAVEAKDPIAIEEAIKDCFDAGEGSEAEEDAEAEETGAKPV